jgi:hypothetical protein
LTRAPPVATIRYHRLSEGVVDPHGRVRHERVPYRDVSGGLLAFAGSEAEILTDTLSPEQREAGAGVRRAEVAELEQPAVTAGATVDLEVWHDGKGYRSHGEVRSFVAGERKSSFTKSQRAAIRVIVARALQDIGHEPV